METISLIYSILGAPRGCVLPFAYAVDLTADCLFKQHMSMEKFKLSDVCRQVAERLPYQLNPRSVESEVGRWANRCLKKIVKEGVAEVSLLRQMECGLHCDGACAGCSAKPPQEILALASNAVGAEPGDFVEVEPAGGRNISTSVAVFLLPCVGLGAGYALGMYVLGLNDLTSMLTAALGLHSFDLMI